MSMARINTAFVAAVKRAERNRRDNIPRMICCRRFGEGHWPAMDLLWKEFAAAKSDYEKALVHEKMDILWVEKYGFPSPQAAKWKAIRETAVQREELKS